MTSTRAAIVEQPDERGAALIGVLLLLVLMSTMAAALSVNAQTETLISRSQRSGVQAQDAAEAGLNHAVEVASTYIFQWNANGFAVGPEEAVAALLVGPDGLSGTTSTDADNGSLGPRVGAGIETAAAIPLGTPLPMVAGGTDTYEAFIIDDDAGAPDEDGLPWNDINDRLIVRATGYSKDGLDESKVVLEAIISPVDLGALVTDGDLDISGNVDIDGTAGNVHANGDLDISGGAADVSGTITAEGTYTGMLPGTGGTPHLNIPAVKASDYKHYADFVLTSSGTMTDQAGTVLCAAAPCNNWAFNSGIGEWSFASTEPATGTYYVEGTVKITGSAGSPGSPVQITIIAEDSIDISGSPDVTADTAELLFVTDGDLEISGGIDAGDPLTAEGQILVHEQIKFSGNPQLAGQVLVENATSVSTLVTYNEISGNVGITYNGGLGTGVFSVTGWRDVR